MLSEDRLYALYRNTRNICESGDSGDFVECGVAGGGSVLLIALVIKKYSRIPRIVYAFDTFEGMPSPSVEDQSIDGISAADSNWGEGTCAAPTEFVTSILEQFGVDDVVNLRKGLFADTLPVFAQSAPSIVLLHMDGDWYRSTYDILENLFDTLKPNSYVQIDDYGHWLGCRRAVDDFFSRRGWKPDLRLIDYTGRYFFSPANKAMGASVSCEKVLVNIGCGGSHSEKWRNFDLHPTSSNVEKFDIRSGIPLPATSADFVYSSHFIEHLSRQDASFFLRECSRVLRDGGLIRVVIPNLEDIVREYLRCFDGAMAGDQNDILKYEWIIHELLDQLTRHRSGGEMIRYLTTMPDSMRNYVENRVGLWIKNVQRQSVIPEDPADAEQVGRFRLSGEVHRWMYDRYSITKLLKEHGFSEVQVLDFATSQLPDFNTYKLDTIDSLRPRKPDSIYIEAKKVAPRVDPTAGITINERNVSPSSFCTIATRGASLDLQALLASLSMHMPGSRIYVFADSYVANHYDQMPFDLRLDIKWNICLDPYSNLNRGIMEKTGIWSDFQMMKGKVINYALSRKESDVMFLDADIFLTAPIVLSGYSDQVAAVSRHHIMKDLEDQYGIYNGGVLWARRKEVVDFWMSRFSSSRYYDQACLEDVFERFDCLVMGEHQNISPYRLFDAQENYKLIMKKFSYRDNALYFKSKAVEFIHTHLSWREPRNFLAFNSFILNLFKNNKDDPNYRMLEYFTSISN
jgi:SAM-dependent methyltransferase